ncbi:MAG: extensin family protein [Devosia sp.]|uniref:extensin-like domain-containing protein n=1 Tax=Devosia sp. TaxID=1871048 RepID=UPI001ACAEF13|nr:extensin family protein [Devosia sp.]MBN9317616.1 extensin family protein [Devosia sp.]
MRIALATLLLLLASLPAQAQQATPPLPEPRPSATGLAGITPAPPEPPIVPLPRHRPAAPTAPAAGAERQGERYGPPTNPDARSTGSTEPPAPTRIYQTACPAVLLGRIEAEALPPIRENGQCGTPSPLSVTGVVANGRMVPVSGGVQTDCGVASALPGWIESIDGYLLARDNTRIAEVLVGTSYMCRNVNNAGEGKLSFHAFADALDVVGFRLEDGRTVTVEAGWADALSAEGRLLRFAHDSACAHFTTVLGPEANALHRDHLHVDLGCHGKACTARLCE